MKGSGSKVSFLRPQSSSLKCSTYLPSVKEWWQHPYTVVVVVGVIKTGWWSFISLAVLCAMVYHLYILLNTYLLYKVSVQIKMVGQTHMMFPGEQWCQLYINIYKLDHLYIIYITKSLVSTFVKLSELGDVKKGWVGPKAEPWETPILKLHPSERAVPTILDL